MSRAELAQKWVVRAFETVCYNLRVMGFFFFFNFFKGKGPLEEPNFKIKGRYSSLGARAFRKQGKSGGLL